MLDLIPAIKMDIAINSGNEYEIIEYIYGIEQQLAKQAEQLKEADKLFEIVGKVAHRSPELHKAWNEYRIKYKGKE